MLFTFKTEDQLTPASVDLSINEYWEADICSPTFKEKNKNNFG